MKWNDRLKKLVDASGLSMAELSRRSGVPYDSLNKYLRGDVENPRGNALEKLARALETSVLYLQAGLTDAQPMSSRAVPYRGVVAAGLWQEAGEGDVSPGEWLSFNPVPQYPEGAVYCLTVRGDSLNKVAPDGSTIVVVDLASTGIAIRDNDLVVVERSRDDGGLIETTAKRVREAAGGYQLVPESTNPKWKPIYYPRNGRSASGETVRLIARVEFILNRP